MSAPIPTRLETARTYMTQAWAHRSFESLLWAVDNLMKWAEEQPKPTDKENSIPSEWEEALEDFKEWSDLRPAGPEFGTIERERRAAWMAARGVDDSMFEHARMAR
jgi:hypothetical protein